MGIRKEDLGKTPIEDLEIVLENEDIIIFIEKIIDKIIKERYVGQSIKINLEKFNDGFCEDINKKLIDIYRDAGWIVNEDTEKYVIILS